MPSTSSELFANATWYVNSCQYCGKHTLCATPHLPVDEQERVKLEVQVRLQRELRRKEREYRAAHERTFV